MKTDRLGHDGSRGEIGTPSPTSFTASGELSFARPAAGPTAYHEAGHAVAAWLFSVPFSVVSIRPGAGYRGMVLLDEASPAHALSDLDLFLPALLQPSETRAAIERSIVVLQVGAIAGHYAMMTMAATGYLSDDPCDDDAQRAAVGLARLSPRHRELVVTREADSTELDDEANAAGLSRALVGEATEAMAHLEWLRATSRGLVAAHWPRIKRLAVALEAQRVLSSDDAVAIIAPPWPTAP